MQTKRRKPPHYKGGTKIRPYHIDDTWTSGDTAESASIMLKQSGAQRVTIYCLARIIDLDYCSRMIGQSVSDGYKQLTYRDGCPWDYDQCPMRNK